VITHQSLKSYYTKTRIEYQGLIPRTITPDANGAIVSVKTEPSADYIDRQSINPFLVDGIPADPAKWPEPPHFALANWKFDDPERVCAFTKRYGALVIKPSPDRGSFLVYAKDLKTYQTQLREAWNGKDGGLLLSIDGSAAPFKHKFDRGELRLTVSDLWSFIRTLFSADYQDGLIGVCPSPNCGAPFFVRNRRGKKQCSEECRNYVNILRWRSDPKNRRREKKLRKQREKA
jgi:hypothetical protein